VAEEQSSLLETFPNPHPGRDYVIETVVPEFTSLCPKTGQPDFGTLTITYTPAEACFELKSLKMYLQSYRNVGAFYEDVTNRILNDLVAAVRPKHMKLHAAFTPRGGIRTNVIVEPRVAFVQQQLPRSSSPAQDVGFSVRMQPADSFVWASRIDRSRGSVSQSVSRGGYG